MKQLIFRRLQVHVIDNKNGAVMAEVLVAFTVLLLIIGIFSRSMALAGRTTSTTDQKLAAHRELIGRYYRDELAMDRVARTLHFQELSGEESFALPVEIRCYSGPEGALYDVVRRRNAE